MTLKCTQTTVCLSQLKGGGVHNVPRACGKALRESFEPPPSFSKLVTGIQVLFAEAQHEQGLGAEQVAVSVRVVWHDQQGLCPVSLWTRVVFTSV